MTALQEVKKRFLQNNKLTPILIGISREGIIRVDPKTKEVNILHCDPCFQLSNANTLLLIFHIFTLRVRCPLPGPPCLQFYPKSSLPSP